MTLNMIYIVAFGVGLKCPCKIHLNTQVDLSTKHSFHMREQEQDFYRT